MHHYRAILYATLLVCELEQDFDPNNVPIKFEKNQWRNGGFYHTQLTRATWQEIAYYELDPLGQGHRKATKNFLYQISSLSYK